MYELVFYSVAILAGFVLFWFYDESSDIAKGAMSSSKASAKEPRNGLLSFLGFNQSDFLGASAIEDRFTSLKAVTEACLRAGLENVRLMIAVDFSASNEWQGRRTFNGECLHKLNPISLTGLGSSSSSTTPGSISISSSSQLQSTSFLTPGGSLPSNFLTACNPYQRVLLTLAQTWEPFLDPRDGVHVFGFGDVNTEASDVFPFHNDGRPCHNFQDVFLAYNDLARTVGLKGPTSLKPVVEKAISLCHRDPTTPAYTVVVIISDGLINNKVESRQAVIEASNHPISIVFIGVGDGPWDTMEEFDDNLKGRKFDNFQFVDYQRTTYKVKYPDVNLGLQVLMEIPDQFQMVRQLNYIK